MPPKVPMLSSRWMIMFVIQYQSHRAGTDLRRELVACLLAHGSTFSRVGASGKPERFKVPSYLRGCSDQLA